MHARYVLYSYFRSSAAWRVRIVLNIKGIAWEYAPVHLLKNGGEQLSPEHRALNPMGEVPVLAVHGPDGAPPLVLTQSAAIAEFLDETVPNPPLLPADPVGRARVRALVQVINSGIHPIQNLKVLNHVESTFGATQESRVAWARHWITRGFEGLEPMLAATAGTHAYGDAVTLADCFIVPQVFNAERFGVDLAAFPTITRIAAAAATLPAFQRAVPAVQPDAPPPVAT
jgi:maleylpyruvate isomerase